jgi:hypothetical protein
MTISQIKLIFFSAIFAAMVVFFGFWRYEVLNHSKTSDALELAKETIKQQKENIIITERASNDYQASIDNLNIELNRLRNRPAKCVPVTSTTSGNNEAATKAKLFNGNGLRTEWLYDYAGRAEETRLRLIGCQRFINSTWESLNK